MRATSTVLDAALFVLFVGAAITTLAVPVTDHPEDDPADATADVLATTTATVTYSLEPGIRETLGSEAVEERRTDHELRRTAHGTLAGHLATAAVGTVEIDGERVTDDRLDHRRAVAAETRAVTRGRTHLSNVSAVWRPYPDAPIAGRVAVGPAPPPAADVHAEQVTVGSGVSDAGAPVRRAAATGDFDDVGSAVAARVVRGLFPPRTTRTAMLGDYPVDPLVSHRYRRFGGLLGTDVSEAVARDDPTTANGKLRRALGRRLAADMHRQFDTPEEAARAVDVETVTITVRTWSP